MNKCDSTIEEWFNSTLKPELDGISTLLISAQDTPQRQVCVNYWFSFLKNLIALSEQIGHENNTYQMASTVRYLMELAADIKLLEQNPSNIEYLLSKSTAIEHRRTTTGIDYKKATRLAQSVKLSCDQCSNSPGPTAKVHTAFCKYQNVKEIYDYLCIYTHSNYIGITWDMQRQSQTVELVREQLFIFGFIWYATDIITHGIGELCQIPQLKEYDISRIRHICESMQNIKPDEIIEREL